MHSQKDQKLLKTTQRFGNSRALTRDDKLVKTAQRIRNDAGDVLKPPKTLYKSSDPPTLIHTESETTQDSRKNKKLLILA